MKFSKKTIAAAVAAIAIGGLSISPAAAKVHPNHPGHATENGRVPTSGQAFKFELNGDTFYNTGRVAPTGTKGILQSDGIRTNGRTG